jgi:hypothetical protein
MSWFVREWFEVGRTVPADTSAPANGSPLFKAIVRRQVMSLDWLRGPVKFWLAALSSPQRLRQNTIEIEWPRIKGSIDAGRMPMLGLVRHRGWNPFDLNRDHQVLAYGYDTAGPDGPTKIRVYDPNWPDRDDVSITLLSGGLLQSTGEPLFGLIDQG